MKFHGGAIYDSEFYDGASILANADDIIVIAGNTVMDINARLDNRRSFSTRRSSFSPTMGESLSGTVYSAVRVAGILAVADRWLEAGCNR